MTWLILGVALWIGAHLFKRVLPRQRAALGGKGRAVVAVAILAGIGLMILGYGQAEKDPLYALPVWAWVLNNILMYVALFMFDAGRAKGLVRTWVRHPMLLGLVLWSTAHLLVNGDLPSLVLFGGLGSWALLEMAVINRAEGAWNVPEKGSLGNDAKVALVAAVIYAAIVAVHTWLGYSVLVVI